MTQRVSPQENLLVTILITSMAGGVLGCSAPVDHRSDTPRGSQLAANPPSETGIIWDAMQRVEINGTALGIYDSGAGEPVVFLHGASSDEAATVLEEPALTSRYRLIYYHQSGYGISERPQDFVSTEQRAVEVKALLDHLGIGQAHFVGQSGGGVILLQLLKAFPEVVHTAALLEPALIPVLMAAETSQSLTEAFARADSLHRAGDDAGVADTFIGEVCGEDYRPVFDRTMPEGWFERFAAETKWVMSHPAPVDYSWAFTADDARRVTQPVLNVTGERAKPYWNHVFEQVRSWFPHAYNVVLPDATHCINQSNPAGSAEHLARFFARHPIDTGS